MKRQITLLTGIILCIYTLSCYRDKGNYDYLDYNKIEKISLHKSSKTQGILGDTIKLIPTFSYRYGNRDTNIFNYEWRIRDSVISKERNLIYVPREIRHQESTVLYITDKYTGITIPFRTHFTITSPYKTGWMILSEKSGESILSYVRKEHKNGENRYADYKDIYKTLYPGRSLGNNPKKLCYIITSSSEDEILLLQEPEQCVYLSGKDFSRFIYLKDEFPGKKYPQGFIPKDFLDGAQCSYLLGENGEIYWKISPAFYGNLHLVYFIPIPLYHKGGLRIDHYPDVRVYGANMSQMYDILNNRILAFYTSFNSGGGYKFGANVEFINNDIPDNTADINDLKNYKLVYMGGGYPKYTLILKDKNANSYLYHTYKVKGQTSALNLRITEHYQEIFAGNSLISENTKFLQLRRSNYMFIGEKNKLYFYDGNTKRIKLYHDFGLGNIVKIAADAPEQEIGVAMDNGRIYICSTDIKFLSADRPGEYGICHEVEGLGRIVDLIWKYGGFYPYIFNTYD